MLHQFAHIRKNRIRTRFRFGSICLLIVVALLPLAPAYGQSDSSLVCLEFEDFWANRSLIDLNTGRLLTDASGDNPVNQIESDLPDGRYIVYVPIADNNASAFNLFLKRNILNGQRTLLQNSVKIENTDAADYQWSHDSRWLAYSWQSSDGRYALSLVEAGTRLQKSTQLNHGAGDIVNLFGWSADDKYLAVGRSNPTIKQQEITIWSAPDLKLVKTISQANMILGRDPYRPFGWVLAPDSIQWSPTGDWLSYVVETGNVSAINLVSVSSGRSWRYQVPEAALIAPQLLWSPGGKYVAFLTAQYNQDTEDVVWTLDLLGVDGTQFSNVTRSLSKQATLAGGEATNPAVYWSADGETIFYGQKIDEEHADLIAFQPSNRHYQTIQPDMLLNPVTTTGNRYLIYAWSDDNQNYTIDLFDTNTLSHIRSKDKLNISSALEELILQTDSSPWIVVFEGAVPDKAFNTTTGAVRDLDPFYAISNNFKQHNRYIAAVIGDKSPYDLQWLDLDTGISKQVMLTSPQYDEPRVVTIGDNGQMVVLSNAKSADYSMLTVLRPDESILRRFEVPTSAIENAQFVSCTSF